MNLHQLQAKFNESINWNAFSYFFYKGTTTLVTFILFKKLTVQDFSTWATTNSIIFLLLLWIDFGFRKSVPRFCPEFAQSKKSHRQFLVYIILFQSIALIASSPLLILFLQKTTVAKAPEAYVLVYAILLFFFEGLVALLRLVYHAHFLNKHFNMRSTIFAIIETAVNLTLVAYVCNSHSLLLCLFASRIGSSLFTSIVCLIELPTIHIQDIKEVSTVKKPWLLFIKHSAAMWASNNVKSLSERNFIIPLLSYVAGPAHANVFKVANDCALFFHRIVVKAIGTTDTTLLSHVHVCTQEQEALQVAFKNLTTKVAGLCIPVIGFLMIFFVFGLHILNDTYVFQTFFIITLGYLLETLTSPYERVLEVKAHYMMLAIAYIPYAIVISLLLLNKSTASIGLLTFILFIQGVRLVSSLLMVRFALYTYSFAFPLKFVFLLLVRSLVLSLSFFLFLFLLYVLCIYIVIVCSYFYTYSTHIIYTHSPVSSVSPLYTYTHIHNACFSSLKKVIEYLFTR